MTLVNLLPITYKKYKWSFLGESTVKEEYLFTIMPFTWWNKDGNNSKQNKIKQNSRFALRNAWWEVDSVSSLFLTSVCLAFITRMWRTVQPYFRELTLESRGLTCRDILKSTKCHTNALTLSKWKMIVRSYSSHNRRLKDHCFLF